MAWHGSSTLPLLEDVTAEIANQRNSPESHIIWEIVYHMQVWKEEARKTLEGGTFPFLPTEKEWPPLKDTSEKAWIEAVQNLKDTHRRLISAIEVFELGLLDNVIKIDKTWPSPWSSTTYYGVLHGTLHHDVYHTGQIAILKKQLQ